MAAAALLQALFGGKFVNKMFLKAYPFKGISASTFFVCHLKKSFNAFFGFGGKIE